MKNSKSHSIKQTVEFRSARIINTAAGALFDWSKHRRPVEQREECTVQCRGKWVVVSEENKGYRNRPAAALIHTQLKPHAEQHPLRPLAYWWVQNRKKPAPFAECPHAMCAGAHLWLRASSASALYQWEALGINLLLSKGGKSMIDCCLFLLIVFLFLKRSRRLSVG